jgi:hypothetical protein
MRPVEVFRASLVEAIRRELVGPVSPAESEELVSEPPYNRYVAGILFPQQRRINEVEHEAPEEKTPDQPAQEEESLSPSGTQDVDYRKSGTDEPLSSYDETIRLANELLPAAMGLSFTADLASDGLVFEISAGVYSSLRSPGGFPQYQRQPVSVQPISFRPNRELDRGEFSAVPVEGLRLSVVYSRRKGGDYRITAALVNTNIEGGRSKVDKIFFQVGFAVRGETNRPIFKEFRTAASNLDAEEKVLELLYRNRCSYAIGHGCAAEWEEEAPGRARLVRTVTVPVAKVSPIEPLGGSDPHLSMFYLAGADGAVAPSDVTKALQGLPDHYETWLQAQEETAAGLSDRYKEAAESNLSQCRQCLSRMRAGIRALEEDTDLLEAFMLANRAMLMQQFHTRLRTTEVVDACDPTPSSYAPADPRSGRWRAFQLGFILMNLSAIAGPVGGQYHPDRSLIDLIWFPTGGGKTEAYLGLTAVSIVYGRLTGKSSDGCSVLMRYTLRLLTAQQFQRASALICALEVLRRKQPERLGSIPVSIGLWVGGAVTPIRRAEAITALNKFSSRNDVDNPFQVLKCPWCGCKMNDKRKLGYVAAGNPKTVHFLCPNDACCFSKRDSRLPILVIDEDIYEAPPTLLIGTVDKFAMLAWRPQARALFGVRGGLGPDLVIQDELHLISGPLGSIVGLYESVIQMLCSLGGRPPKIIASTATIRRASDQCSSLYNLETFQFPPQALDISDSFFAKENAQAPGRLYVGVMASASPSFLTTQVRVLSALLQLVRSLSLPEGADATVRDPYWTLLQYFGSLRELGMAATLLLSDIPQYIRVIGNRDDIPKELRRRVSYHEELTSRVKAERIPEILEQMEIPYSEQQPKSNKPLDSVCATNMISVGVDVGRLGLMTVLGQPKTTSEYIQATSRVGRSADAPGLVVTMFNPGRPRDRSHYEHFLGYHNAFYKYVEPTSVTPFSIPAMERALFSLLVISQRHIAGIGEPRLFRKSDDTVKHLRDFLVQRCRKIDEAQVPHVESLFDELVAQWDKFAPSAQEWGRLGPAPENAPIMYPAGSVPRESWNGVGRPTPTSMRSVDGEVGVEILSYYPDSEDSNGLD